MIRILRPVPTERLRLLIFDLDGTLIDSRTDLANSVNAMLRQYQREELSPEVIAAYIGDGAPTLVRRSLGFPDDLCLTPADEEFMGEALAYFLDFYREHKLDNTYAYEGVVETLRKLSSSSSNGELKMAVLTNKPVGPSRAIVEALGMQQFFHRVYGGNSFQTKKPQPDGVKALLSELNVTSEESIIVGDSYIDILTARNAGIWSCGVTYGLAPESLANMPGDIMVDSPTEWLRVFGQ